ncbi:MAG: hypothetical protein WC241_04600 [Candidatus Paceibacterota bacterium]|jgi:hypothetical protein
MKQLLQCDGKWGMKSLGTSNVTICGYGCLITCASMLADMDVGELNSALIRVNGYQDQNLLIWAKLGEATNGKLTFNWLNYIYNNEGVKQVIADEGGCIVQVQNGDYMHFVLYIGNGKMYDPLSGEAPTSKYPDVLGFADISVRKDVVIPTIPPSEDWQAKYEEKVKLETELRGIVEQKDQLIKTLQLAINEKNANIVNVRNELKMVADKLELCQQQANMGSECSKALLQERIKNDLLERQKIEWRTKEQDLIRQNDSLTLRLNNITKTLVPKKYLSLKIYNLIMNLEGKL